VTLSLSEPFREVSVNAFVAHRGTEKDLTLLDRFLRSLYASDFPRTANVNLIGPAYDLDTARRLGAVTALQGAEWVLMSDTDCVVPRLWWKDMTRVLLAATPKPIGIVGTKVNGTTVHQRQGIQFPNPPAPMYELGFMDHDNPPYYRVGDPQYLFDGFVLFRSLFLSRTGLYPDAGIHWFLEAQKKDWSVVITNLVTIDHNKG